jgi:hypothetical protein
LDSLEVINIIEFKEYHGVNVSIAAYLDRTKVAVSIDIGFGDIIYPERRKMKFPVLLDMEAPEVYESGFTEDVVRQNRWNSFIKKKCSYKTGICKSHKAVTKIADADCRGNCPG